MRYHSSHSTFCTHILFGGFVNGSEIFSWLDPIKEVGQRFFKSKAPKTIPRRHWICFPKTHRWYCLGREFLFLFHFSSLFALPCVLQPPPLSLLLVGIRFSGCSCGFSKSEWGVFFICFSFPSRTVILLHRVYPFLPFISFSLSPIFLFSRLFLRWTLVIAGAGGFSFLVWTQGPGFILFSYFLPLSSFIIFCLVSCIEESYVGKSVCGREDSFSLKGKGSVGGESDPIWGIEIERRFH